MTIKPEEIHQLLSRAEKYIPCEDVPDLPPKDFADIPEWHGFEHNIWALGEKVRHALVENPRLRKDKDILESILQLSTSRRSKRGRQSFIMLLGYKHCNEYAQALIDELDDKFVCGHVINTLAKMHAFQFSHLISPYIEHELTWVRNSAKKYMAKVKKATNKG